ncbi:uncharacterized protein PpBr36_06756 [Pyricularia pennisetigena]|uniref:uncharacterized protein n=1 Tax=Pyricularia pennisetigena TaxID=1578925 RepID=UPI0011520EE4|nr:uncharacterized protein PpBr36_06756 [Pyricularia pennisetigena]TLS23057.1 hypothetical protein PpBr36_06756 [Pyricularia pennisetigena]
MDVTTSSRPTEQTRVGRRDSAVDLGSPTPLPVTLLSGFLGSGKTTLLQHILRSDHGLRIAVIVNDIGAVNVDASIINHHVTQTTEKVIALQNGCICCTLRGDLLEELVRLSELHAFDYVIVESSGISEPEQVAETFDSKLAETMGALGDGSAGAEGGLDEAMRVVLRKLADAGGVGSFARLDTTVTVVDAFTIMNDFHTDHLLSSRRGDVGPEDERTVSDLMVDQIEFADVIVLNKTDMVDRPTKQRVVDLITKLNHRAKIIETSHSKVDVKEIVNTGLFDLERAQTGYGWLQDLHELTLREVNGRKTITPKPETEEYNVRNFVYRRQRPFHPLRLYKLLFDKFIMQLEHPEEEEDEDEDEDDEEEEDDQDEQEEEDPLDAPSNETILANKRASPLFARLFRSKGEFFLATRPHRAGEWSQAGAMLTMTGGRPWFVTLPESEYLTGDADIDALVLHDLASGGEWGDRRQELVFIGEALDVPGLERVLDECLLTDEEWRRWRKVMRSGVLSSQGKMERLARLFDDGFPDWPEDDAHEGHGH